MHGVEMRDLFTALMNLWLQFGVRLVPRNMRLNCVY